MSRATADVRGAALLTGGVAAGKTAVSDRLQRLGATIIDTDLIAREVVEPGSPGLARVVERFGAGLLSADGRLDRPAMRELVFKSSDDRQALETILHPLIEQRVIERAGQASGGQPIVIVVPLLVESGLFADLHPVIVVDVPEALQIERLMARDGMTREQADAMLAAQASRKQRLARADYLIDNSGTLQALNQQVDDLYRQLTRR